MGTIDNSKIHDQVHDYFTEFYNLKRSGKRVFIDMCKVNNFHIFNERYAIFHSFSEYKSKTGKVLFNIYVSPIDDKFTTLSILVRVCPENLSNVLSSLSTVQINKKED